MPMYGKPQNPVPTTYASPRPFPSPVLGAVVPPDPARFGAATGGAVTPTPLREGLFKQLYRLGRGMDNPGEVALRGQFGDDVGAEPLGGGGVPPGIPEGAPVGPPGVQGGVPMPQPTLPDGTPLPGFPQSPPSQGPKNSVVPPWMAQAPMPPPGSGGLGQGGGGTPYGGRFKNRVPGLPVMGPERARGGSRSSSQSKISRLMPVAPDGRRR